MLAAELAMREAVRFGIGTSTVFQLRSGISG
jgi:hypothetical protein